jgi:nucleoid-associated protein YgaU
MLNKKQTTVENDFMEYDFSDNIHEGKVKKKGSLGSIIQFLVILLLIGILAIGGMFGYRYFQKNIQQVDKSNPNDTPKERVEVAMQNVEPKQNTQGQKMYTQEQMKAIVQMMMQQINNKSDKTGAIKNSTENSMQLINSLTDIEVDQMNDIVTSKQKKANITKKVTKTNSDNIDRYNKVVIKKNDTTVDDISSQLNSAIQDLNQKEVKDSYTQSISNEISTRENEMRVIIVREGDSLSKIAKRAYGSVNAYDIIIEANPDLIKNPNRIFVGQKLRIPSITN